ncbi:MAG: hypothetical protein IJ908_06120 [Fibrobacter sp.]|nr:hypothetical protein [Fibrobacter sp.]
MNSSGRKSKFWAFLAHPLFTAIMGAAVGAVLTYFLNNVNIERNYIPFDNIDNLMNTFFVSSGLIGSDELLGKEISEQIKIISEQMSSDKNSIQFQKEQLTGLREALRTQLVALGEKSSVVEKKSDDWLCTTLSSKISSFSQTISKKDEEMSQMKSQIAELKSKISELESRKEAEIVDAKLVVEGEVISESSSNAVARVDGHSYFSESVLNTFLDNKISYSTNNNTLTYGEEQPEKEKFDWSLVSDYSNVSYYASGGGETFKMSTDKYDHGIVCNYYRYNETVAYIQLKKKYSEISFTVGHIDGTSMSGRTLYIYTTDEYGNYTSEAKYRLDLYGEMPVTVQNVPINYAQSIKIMISKSSDNSQYGLADIYLHK